MSLPGVKIKERTKYLVSEFQNCFVEMSLDHFAFELLFLLKTMASIQA